MIAFEDAFFGHKTLTREQFEQCLAAARRISRRARSARSAPPHEHQPLHPTTATSLAATRPAAVGGLDAADRSASSSAVVLLIVAGRLAWPAAATSSCPRPMAAAAAAEAGRSVNGTAVLAEMFKRSRPPRDDDGPPLAQAERVRHHRLGSRRLRAADQGAARVPGRVAGRAATERTVVYVGRDYDAAVAYWDRDRCRKRRPSRPTRRFAARPRPMRLHEAARSKMPAKQYARWFTVAPRPSRRRRSTKLDRRLGRRDRRQPRPTSTSRAGWRFPRSAT